jgi:high affinity Mn2+ porin
MTHRLTVWDARWVTASCRATAITAVVIAVSSAVASDLPIKASRKAADAVFDWTGFYAGLQFGFAAGSSRWSAAPFSAGSPGLAGSFGLPPTSNFMAGTGSYFAGLQAGYNYVVPSSHLLLGAELDASAPNSDVLRPYSIQGRQTVIDPVAGFLTFGEQVIEFGTARARVGYADNHWLIYATGGLAWTYGRRTRTLTGFDGTISGPDNELFWRLGWVAGAGIEVPLSPRWSAKLEYRYAGFADHAVTFPGGQQFRSNLALQSALIGVNYHIGNDAASISDVFVNGPRALETDNFAFHAQATYTNQYNPPFRSPYLGTNSLIPNIGRETFDLTLFSGLRLWQGAELWFNPEVDQGFGLSGSVGAAGFPSAEAYKVGASYPYTRIQRLFVRQTINLGGDEQTLDAGINQFSGKQTSDRLVLTVGKFGVVDIFDTNKYAHDPRGDFMNWALADTGTFDYAADAWAYTVGAAAEWYTGPWTLRAGAFDLSIAPNTTMLDPRLSQFQLVGEIERRYSLFDQPGKIAVTGFLTRGRMGSFADAIALAAITGNPADITQVRRYDSRPGVSVNLEQQIVDNVGLFVRAGVANGQREPYEFTDIDRTVAAGLSISGKLWGRDGDTFGIAGVINSISSIHQAFLNAGGLGILVGDGMLPNPGTERILETYYSLPVLWTKLTLDYQLITNPAYNKDRGPVSVFGVRAHWQY